jgi:hypothetical protein
MKASPKRSSPPMGSVSTERERRPTWFGWTWAKTVSRRAEEISLKRSYHSIKRKLTVQKQKNLEISVSYQYESTVQILKNR